MSMRPAGPTRILSIKSVAEPSADGKTILLALTTRSKQPDITIRCSAEILPGMIAELQRIAEAVKIKTDALFVAEDCDTLQSLTVDRIPGHAYLRISAKRKSGRAVHIPVARDQIPPLVSELTSKHATF